MNTIQINLSKNKAMEKASPLLQSVKLVLAQKGVSLSEEETKELTDKFVMFLSTINFALEN